MNSFVYDIPTKVYFGSDQLGHLGDELKRFGNRVLLTYGGGSIKKTGLYDRVTAEICRAGLELFELSGIEPNPRVDSVRKGAELCRREKIDVLLAVGGGSVIDATKFIGAGTFYDGDPWELSTGKGEIKACLPIVTVLTLSATGSEMDTGGVISNPETKDKLGRLDPHMLPKVSFLDPVNTYTVSAYQTACGSADILSHLFEVYFNMQPDLYMLDCFMEGLMKTVIRYTPVAIEKPDDYEARANLMWASSWAINGFVNGGKEQEWTCHPIEHEVSAIYDITHGLGLAIITPRWMEYCLDETTVSKYRQFAVNVFGIDENEPPMSAAKAAIAKLSDFLFGTLGLKSTFSALGIDDSNFALMARKACEGKAIHGFKTLTPDDVEKILRMCL
ncbi:MAG: NADH-dependent alcohol dehydrogenase [Clostridiales bacterium]|jgi:hypothetical protein|nr:MAG: NADH-dependent alcohol dehydrogenase [Clostridiales bacterium]